ncbi:MAG: thiolase family protein [Rhodobacteraceae bacterium]|nr:thiolase family protein [Paracoccaceae bacterium]
MAEIPYGGYWSSPFARWQGALGDHHSLKLAAFTLSRWIEARAFPGEEIEHGILGLTVPQQGVFYGLPWLMARAGLPHVAGPTISQACATSARCLATALGEVTAGRAGTVLAVTADRTSNGPLLYHPEPRAPGGQGRAEAWVPDNFNDDPHLHLAMVDTAENVAARENVTREEQNELTLHRRAQYDAALADDRAFQRRYMELPFALPDRRFDRVAGSLEGDEGIYPAAPEKVARLSPVREGGTVTLAAQTHPADGNAGMIVASPERARALSARPEIRISVLAIAEAREAPGFMPAAPVPATARALDQAGLRIADIDAIKSHNPFALNDIVFARAFGIDWREMNNFGCSLIWGHPQAPTGMRAMIELIDELVMRGGGTGLFQGCAAGDSAMAIVLRVDER